MAVSKYTVTGNTVTQYVSNYGQVSGNMVFKAGLTVYYEELSTSVKITIPGLNNYGGYYSGEYVWPSLHVVSTPAVSGGKIFSYSLSGFSGKLSVTSINVPSLENPGGALSSDEKDRKEAFFINGMYQSGVTYTIPKGTAAKSITVSFTVSTYGDYSSTASKTFSVPALTKYTVTLDKNGGTGGQDSITFYQDQSFTMPTSVPTREGYDFLGWGTSKTAQTATYTAGTTYAFSNRPDPTIYAVWSIKKYTVSFNANSGSGAPANATKQWGTPLTLSSTKPVKDFHRFLGWATSASGDVVYQAGGIYTDNAAITLYAKWVKVYENPTIRIAASYRIDNDGDPSDDGDNVRCDVDFTVFRGSTETDNKDVDIKFYIKESTQTDIMYSLVSTVTRKQSGSATCDTFSSVFPVDGVSTDSMYNIKVTLEDKADRGITGAVYTAQAEALITSAYFTMDFLAGGHGIAFGGPSRDEGFVNNMPTTFKDRLLFDNPPTGSVISMESSASNTSLLVKSHRMDTGKIIYYGVGVNGNDRGLYDGTGDKWIIRSDANNNIHTGSGGLYVDGKAYFGGDMQWVAPTNWALKASANNQEFSFDVGNDLANGTQSYTGLYAQFWSQKNSKTIASFHNDDCSVRVQNGNTYLNGLRYLPIGTNTINSTSNDTTAKWGEQGNSVHWYNTTGLLNGQPSQWAYLLNYGNGSEVHQIWLTQSNGEMAHRGGNASGFGGWRYVLDSSNLNGRLYKVLYANDSGATGSVTLNESAANFTFIEVYSKKPEGTNAWVISKAYVPNGKAMGRIIWNQASDGKTYQFLNRWVKCTGTTLEQGTSYFINNGAGFSLNTDGTGIRVYYVVGYR